MRRRLLTSYLALTVVVLVALIVPLGAAYSRREREHLEASLMRDAFVLSSYVEDALETGDTTGVQDAAMRYDERTGARAVIVDADGTLLADSDSTPEDARSFASRPEIAEALGSKVATGTRTSETLGTSLLYVAVPVASGGEVHGAVRLTYSTAQVDARVHRYWVLLALVAGLSLVVATIVGLWLARWVARPVQRLRDAATSFGAGDLDARAPSREGPPEIRELADAFNVTAARLQSLVHAQDQFVSDASHQLRTPLTAIRLRLEMIEDDLGAANIDHERIGGDVVAARAEVARLNRLVDGLLALATAERVGTPQPTECIRVDDVVADRVEAWQPVAAEHGVTLVDRTRPQEVMATTDRVSQVLDNLVANAIDASPLGGVVTIELGHDDERGSSVELHVVDEGPGMSTEQRAHAFDRFWRAGSSDRGLGGSGLGLAIVRKLVEADGGEVELRAGPGGGLDAVVRLAPSKSPVERPVSRSGGDGGGRREEVIGRRGHGGG